MSLSLSGALLTDEIAVVPRIAVRRSANELSHDGLLFHEGGASVCAGGMGGVRPQVVIPAGC